MQALKQLASWGKGSAAARLEQLYLDSYQAQQRAATRYQVLLLAAALLMLGYIVFAYYRMREGEQQLRIAATAFETQEGILITALDHRIIRVNHAFTQLTGYTAQEALGQTPDLLSSERHDANFYPDMWESIGRDKYWEGEVWSRRKNGEVYPIWLTTTAVTDAKKRVTHYVSAFSDNTQRKEAEEQIRQLAFYDPLTKLPNRRLLMDRLNHIMSSGMRNLDYGAVLFIDLDNFKTLNDTQGHDVGDMLLIEIAQRLQACVRAADTVSRIGGDEFVVMLDQLGTDSDQAVNWVRGVGEKIRASINQVFWLKDIEYYSSCSIGISMFHCNDITVEDLLKRADSAMYEAKFSGRNALRFFEPKA